MDDEPIAAQAVGPADVADVRDFLVRCDLTLAGLDEPAVRLWAVRAASGAVVGTTGFELSTDGRHALLRSVAVDPTLRASGAGTRLAMFALGAAQDAGADRAWLFSRRSGPFWQRLGFVPAELSTLAAVLADTTQVTLFRASGQLEREVAWSRCLRGGHPRDAV